MASIAPLLLFLAAPAADSSPGLDSWQWHRRLSEISAPCTDPVLDIPIPRGMDHARDARRLIDAMLRTDPVKCPGIAQAAVAELRAALGEVERGEVDLELLFYAWRSAERGQGMAPDPALADRYGRMLWLFGDRPPELPRWIPAEREAWLQRPETVALLRARNADGMLRTGRSLEALGGLLLRRDLPYYAPAEAIALLEDGRLFTNLKNRLRISRLLTDGTHVPPDYGRAARPFLSVAAVDADFSSGYQQELLRIGYLASVAARTPAERADALRIVSAAALDGRFDSREVRARLLSGLGQIGQASLSDSDQAGIEKALDWQMAWALPGTEGLEGRLRPIVIRGLVGPNGRVIAAEIKDSSGSARHDRAALGVWSEYPDRVELGAVSRGGFVWVELPPVDPYMTTSDAWVKHNSPPPPNPESRSSRPAG
ncbi:MAG TPA: energy transducer TonB [Allosphingosinicella sp.]